MSDTLPVERAADGTFLKGTSGNPNGRPKGLKNHITQLKQELEVAVRDHIEPKRIKRVLAKMMDLAEEGNVGAAKLVLDKVLSNAKDTEDEAQGQGRIIFEVHNLTLKHPDAGEVIDVTPVKE